MRLFGFPTPLGGLKMENDDKGLDDKGLKVFIGAIFVLYLVAGVLFMHQLFQIYQLGESRDGAMEARVATLKARAAWYPLQKGEAESIEAARARLLKESGPYDQ